MTQLPILSLIQLLGGLLLLIIGAELLVRAAVRLAASVRVRPLLIGLTIVAFGSSAPQMAVSLQAAFQENADIAVGSVIGGNIFNTLVTLGHSLAGVAPTGAPGYPADDRRQPADLRPGLQ